MPLRLSLIFLIILNIANTVMFSTPFKITNYNIYSDKINGSIKIAFISDLHLKEYGDDNSILLKEISNLNPDIIAVAGDSIIYNENDQSSAIKFLNNSAKIAPTYFSPGNHEWSQIYTKRDKQLYNDLRNSDAIYLSNEVSKLEINGNEIIICGVFDTVTAKHNTTDIPFNKINKKEYDSKFKLVMSHCPTTIQYTSVKPKADLILSGHEHGGQIVIPFTNQGLYSRFQGFLPKYTSGIHTIENNLVVISTGLSNSNNLIPRINNKPELVVINVN